MNFYREETQNETKQVVNNAFPPIIITATFAAGNGVIKAGTIVASDDTDACVTYEEDGAGSLGQVFGVATRDVNTDAEGGALGAVLRLGMVYPDALTINTPAALKALAAEKIFAY